MAFATTICLGNIVKDKVSGFTGIVTSRSDLYNGTVQFGIQPKVDPVKNEIPEAKSIDDFMLEVLEKGFANDLPPIDDSCTIVLGNRIQDRITQTVGIAIEKVTFQNGCVFIHMRANKLNSDGKDILIFRNHKEFIEIDSGLNAVPAAQDAPRQEPKQEARRYGGPMRPAPKQS